MTAGYNGKLSDPEWRRARARKAAYAKHSPDALVARLEREWETLTEAQRARVSALVGSA